MPANRAFLTGQILAEHSKAQTMRLVQWVGDDRERLADLLEIFLGSDYRLTQRSAWILRHIGDRMPVLLQPRLPELVATLRRPGVHPAVQRNVLGILESVEIPDSLQDEVADYCFQQLADPQAPIAVRAISITLLDNICRKVPELRPGFHLLLEEHFEHATAAFRSRARKILKPQNRKFTM